MYNQKSYVVEDTVEKKLNVTYCWGGGEVEGCMVVVWVCWSDHAGVPS